VEYAAGASPEGIHHQVALGSVEHDHAAGSTALFLDPPDYLKTDEWAVLQIGADQGNVGRKFCDRLAELLGSHRGANDADAASAGQSALQQFTPHMA
jgi:hypothetical protein